MSAVRPAFPCDNGQLWVGTARPEQRTVGGSLASTSIERLLSGFRPSERTTAYVLCPQYLVNRSVAMRSFGCLYDRLWPSRAIAELRLAAVNQSSKAGQQGKF